MLLLAAEKCVKEANGAACCWHGETCGTIESCTATTCLVESSEVVLRLFDDDSQLQRPMLWCSVLRHRVVW
jgi:hypothetical protein